MQILPPTAPPCLNMNHWARKTGAASTAAPPVLRLHVPRFPLSPLSAFYEFPLSCQWLEAGHGSCDLVANHATTPRSHRPCRTASNNPLACPRYLAASPGTASETQCGGTRLSGPYAGHGRPRHRGGLTAAMLITALVAVAVASLWVTSRGAWSLASRCGRGWWLEEPPQVPLRRAALHRPDPAWWGDHELPGFPGLGHGGAVHAWLIGAGRLSRDRARWRADPPHRVDATQRRPRRRAGWPRWPSRHERGR